MCPPSNAFLAKERLWRMESFYPLHALVCGDCLLVQLEQFESPQSIFGDYVYFSSYSDTWLAHARKYVTAIIPRLGLGSASSVVEIASNDGYLLQYFVEAGVPVLGVEPAANVAGVARQRGINTIVKFFGSTTAAELVAGGARADLIIGNNVLAHVPDLNDFVVGLSILLAPEGVITMEFPHLLRLIEFNQFDTIYHEHFSYFSMLSVAKIFAAHDLVIYDVDEIPTHGGSLRIYASHKSANRVVTPAVEILRKKELERGLGELGIYIDFEDRVRATKRHFLEFLISAKQSRKSIVAYGAAAKGNTLLNYCGARGDFIDYAVDRSPYKQGLFLPGSHIEVCSPDLIRQTRPDYLLILPWNIKEEIMDQMAFIRGWGGRFVVPIPTVQIFP
jgi:2-polyprenyl-3-methyl-5-hydroxy-6-metoxy-1,4-benzoquinol methylase